MMQTSKDRSPWRLVGAFACISALVLMVVSLAGCVESPEPLLTDAKPLFGDKVRIQVSEIREHGVRPGLTISYQWAGSRYVGDEVACKEGLCAFSIHPLDGRDYVVQAFDKPDKKRVIYLIARRLADGVFLLFLIEE